MFPVVSCLATDGKDRHGLKLEDVGPTFSSINDMPVKITKTLFCYS